MAEALTLQRLNEADDAGFVALLAGIYEHSPWVAERAASRRPFATLAQLKRSLVEAVTEAPREDRLKLLRAHPELAGKAMVAKALTAESSHEQGKAGLTACTPDEYATLQRLNAAYNEKFGFPFMLAVRGPRGDGLSKTQILATFARRLENHPDFEFEEALRNVHRVAELRLDDRFGHEPVLGRQAWDCAELLARHSDPGFAENGQLTVTYLTDAHRACQAQLVRWMKECGFDEAKVDAVGNVVGVYRADPHPGPLPRAGEGGIHPRPRHGGEGRGEGVAAKRLLTGSHFDTVRNGGKYDGRLGIFVPLVCVRELHRARRRLPFAIEVVGFAEEEGQRYKATFLGSGALIGKFDTRWLDQEDAAGITMREAMRHAGLPATPAAIAALQRDPARYLGFVEVHIEQGPVLTELGLPLGVVTSINGGVRFAGEVRGMASHAGTTPMASRRDAAAAVAELALYLEKRAAEEPHLVGTMGMLEVPGGSTNVIPGRCRFSLDIRATTDPVRDDCVADVLAELHAICERRGVTANVEETMRVAASPSAPEWQARWERAVGAAALPVHRMPSGAGHDAMKLGEAMPQAMLFVRGENSGISHNPLESSTADDMQLAVEAFLHLLDQLAEEAGDERRPMISDYARLDHWIDAHFAEETAFLQALVRVPTDTPPGDNAPHAACTADLLAEFGFIADRYAVPEQIVREQGMTSITNLLVRRRYGEGPTIALNAHGDVVPPGESWTHDPYGGAVEAGRLYGRAAAVSKSDFATYTFAVRALESLGLQLKGGVELHFTYDEEFGGELGPGWLLKMGLTKPDLLIAAGFSYQVITAHNGCLQLEVTVHGKMAHAAIPATGVDALQGANAILSALYAENEAYRRVTSKVPGISHPYVNVGTIQGGTNTNVVPGKVVLRLDRRMIPEEDPTEVEARVRWVIEDAAARRPGITLEIKRLLLARALQPLPGNALLVAALQRHGEAVFGEAIPVSGTPLYTDVRLYGEAGVPAAIYGAGPRTVLESNAKRADEHLVLEDLRRATQVVARTLLDLLS